MNPNLHCAWLQEKKLKRPVPEIEAYLMARTEEGKDYADIDAHDNVVSSWTINSRETDFGAKLTFS